MVQTTHPAHPSRPVRPGPGRGQFSYGEAVLLLTQRGHALIMRPGSMRCKHCDLAYDVGPRYPFSYTEVSRPCQEHARALH